MSTTTKPDKRLTCEYMESRAHAEDPPPSPEEIRRQLGWDLIPHNNDREDQP